MWCHRGEGLAGARKAHTSLHSTAGHLNRIGQQSDCAHALVGHASTCQGFTSSALMRQGRAARVHSLGGGPRRAASVPLLRLEEEGMPQRLPRCHALGWIVRQQLLDQVAQLLRMGTHGGAAGCGQQALHRNELVHRPDAALAGRPCRHGGRGRVDAVRGQWRLGPHLGMSVLHLPAALAGSVEGRQLTRPQQLRAKPQTLAADAGGPQCRTAAHPATAAQMFGGGTSSAPPGWPPSPCAWACAQGSAGIEQP